MQDKYENKKVVLLALSDEKTSTVKRFAKKTTMNYIVGSDAKFTFKKYGVKAYPTIFVLDPSNEIVYVGHDGKEAEKTIKRLLKESPPKSVAKLGANKPEAAYKKALKYYKKKKYAKALAAYEEVVKDYKGTDAAKKAKAKIKKIKSNERIMAKIRDAEAKKKCESLLATARMFVSNGKIKEAKEHYQRIVDEYPDTSYAEEAEEKLATL